MIGQGLTREQANALYLEAIEAEDEDALRRLCKEDLFFLLTVACKRKDIDRDWLYERCREVELNPNGHLDLWAREHYKAVNVNELVPTPTGWKNHGDLAPGDEVFGGDGIPCRVVAKTEVFYDAECFKVSFDDGYSVVVSAEHLWMVEEKSRRRIKGEANKRHYRDQKTLKTRDIFKKYKSVSDGYSIKQVGVDCPEDELPIAPYVLGAWLGDGHSADGRITCGDPELFKYIESFGYSLSSGNMLRTVYGIRPILRAIGVLHNKNIPQRYLRSSHKQRRELLQGLMDTDGHASTRGTATFVNKNKALADGVFELCASLGLKPTIRTHMYNHGAVYHVSFQAYKEDAPFKLERKLARCKDGQRKGRRFIKLVERVPSIPVSCIQVDREDGLYLIGRHFVTTHNSTIITFGKTIQDILNDPNITIGVFSHTRPIAKAFLKQIKTEFERNTLLKNLFPDILYADPQKEAPRWSLDEGIRVKRDENPKEETIEAWGLVDGQPTSKHYKLLLYDDVVTKESVTTPDQINKTTEAWELSLDLGAEGGQKRYIGTRYHLHDTYKVMIDRGSARVRLHAATHNGQMDGEPVLLSRERLMEKRRDQGPYTFSCQQLLNPVADKAMSFKPEWVKYYERIDYSDWNIYLLVDPASAKKTTSDYTVMKVIGLAPDGNKYLIDAIRDRLNLTQRTEKLFYFHRKYKPKKTGYERYGKDSDIEHIKSEMEHRNYRFEIAELGGSMPKADRIKRMVPDYENGKWYLPKMLEFRDYQDKRVDYVATFLKEEYNAFPVLVHDDMLDCQARIHDIGAEFPKIEETVEENIQPVYHEGGLGWLG